MNDWRRGSGNDSGGGGLGDLNGISSPREWVEFHLEVAGATGRWGVQHVSLDETLNRVPRCSIEARYDGHPEVSELLHQEATVTIERLSTKRAFKGIVWHARVHDAQGEGESEVHLVVAPAMAYLAERMDSHIYQDMTAVDVIKAVHQEMLGGLSRTVDTDRLQRSYETREYTVQYQESHLDFLSRLTEDEGIFWYFDHEGDHEVLVLADTPTNLPKARPDHEGQVHYHEDPDQFPDDEAVFEIEHLESVGATDVVLSGYDWTHPQLDVLVKEAGRSDHAPALEIFDHADPQIFHSFNGQYGGHTSAIQAELRTERLDLVRQSWRMGSTVVTGMPGHTLEVVGAPDGALDQRYLIVSATSEGSSTEGVSGTWTSTLDAVPASMPYRPARKTPRPIASGPELATVVGPSGSEIHTDEHGRVRVRFPWDRYHARGAEDSSCWIRVSHSWAGPGFGSFFLPRIGMEVLVSFLGGNPDRPLVTGCVYNGDNHAKVELDAKKTQTLIRTKSSPNSDGFNEMRFEDEAGNEFIYVHAEKDYDEEVEHNHSTHVKNDQRNTVDHDQTETIGHCQTMTVKKDRTKVVKNDEHSTIQNHRTLVVNDGLDQEEFHTARNTEVWEGDTLTVHTGNRRTVIEAGSYEVEQKKNTRLRLKDTILAETPGNVDLKSGLGTVHISAQRDGNLVTSADQTIQHLAENLNAIIRQAISLTADREIVLRVGGSTITIGPSEIRISSPTVKIDGPNNVLINS